MAETKRGREGVRKREREKRGRLRSRDQVLVAKKTNVLIIV